MTESANGFSAWSGLPYDRAHTRAYRAIEVTARRDLIDSGVEYDEIRMRIPALSGRAEMEDLVRCPIGDAHNRTEDRRLHMAKLCFVSIYYRHDDAEPMTKAEIIMRRMEAIANHSYHIEGEVSVSSLRDYDEAVAIVNGLGVLQELREAHD